MSLSYIRMPWLCKRRRLFLCLVASTISVELSATGAPPVMLEGSSVHVEMDEDAHPIPFALFLNASDFDGDPLSWAVATNASFGVASVTGSNTSAGVSYVPALNHYGGDSFVISANDGVDFSYITVDVQINPVNDAPRLRGNVGLVLFELQEVIITTNELWSSDVDDDLDQITYTIAPDGIGSAPFIGSLYRDGVLITNGAKFTEADLRAGLVTYAAPITPFNLAFDSFQFRISDAAGAVASDGPNTIFTFPIRIEDTNFPPTTVDSAINVKYAGSITSQFVAADINLPQDTLTYSIVNNGILGVATLVDVNAGTFIYTATSYYVRAYAVNSVGTSYSSTISFTTLPGINWHPEPKTITKGYPVSFQVSVSGGGTETVSYQWKLNGTPISGATDSIYHISQVDYSDAGIYSVDVSNIGGTITSSGAELTVVSPEGGDVHFGLVNAGINGIVRAVVAQPDGKILIGGDFTAINGTPRGRVARLNADGSLDTTFGQNEQGVNSTVYSLALQSDGKVLVGGQFWLVNGQSRSRLARLNPDGTLDATFADIMENGEVYAIVVQPDGKVLIGGTFGSLSGQTRGRVARLNPNGSLDTTFGNNTAGANNLVFTLARQSDGSVVIGGLFSQVNGVSRSGIARLNEFGALDTTFASGLTVGWVESIAVQGDGNVVIGGQFNTVNGQPRAGIARLTTNGALDPDFGASLRSSDVGGAYEVHSVALQNDGKVVFGGRFGGEFAELSGNRRGNFARLNSDGTLDATFGQNLAGANNRVRCVALQGDGRILIGGDFTQVNGVSRPYLARVEAVPPAALRLTALAISTGSLVPAFSDAIFSYAVSVSLSSITVTPTSSELNSTIEVRINGGAYTTVTSGQASGALELNVGANVVEVRLTGANSAVVTYTIAVTYTPPPAPGVPTAYAATVTLPTSFQANWGAASDAASYRLDVSTVNTFSSFVPGYQDLTVNGLNQVVSGLTGGQTYYYRVRAFNATATSTDSSTISVIIPILATVNVTLLGETASSVEFIASAAAVNNATGFVWQISSDPDFNTVNREEQSSSSSVILTGLAPNRELEFYRVQVFSEDVVVYPDNVMGVMRKSIPVNQWTAVSVPFSLNNRSFSGSFGDDLAAQLNTGDEVRVWDAGNQSWVVLTLGADDIWHGGTGEVVLGEGQGFFIRQNSGAPVVLRFSGAVAERLEKTVTVQPSANLVSVSGARTVTIGSAFSNVVEGSSGPVGNGSPLSSDNIYVPLSNGTFRILVRGAGGWFDPVLLQYNNNYPLNPGEALFYIYRGTNNMTLEF